MKMSGRALIHEIANSWHLPTDRQMTVVVVPTSQRNVRNPEVQDLEIVACT
jgi:hypothetical protein